MGLESTLFNIPVCNTFREKFIKNQFCYEIDVNELRDEKFQSQDLKLGFSFLIDTNDVRQTETKKTVTKSSIRNSREDLGIYEFLFWKVN